MLMVKKTNCTEAYPKVQVFSSNPLFPGNPCNKFLGHLKMSKKYLLNELIIAPP